MLLLDHSLSVSGVRRTTDGYLVAVAKVARIGVQDYLGSEVGKPEMPLVRVYRPRRRCSLRTPCAPTPSAR